MAQTGTWMDAMPQDAALAYAKCPEADWNNQRRGHQGPARQHIKRKGWSQPGEFPRPLPLPRSKIRSEKAEVSSLAVKNPLGPTSCQRGLHKARRSPCRTRQPNIRRTDISAPENRRIWAGGCRQDKERGTKGREYNRSADRLDLESEGSSGPNQQHGVEAEQRNSQASTGGGGARPLSPPLWAGFSSQAEPHWSLRSPSTQSARRRVPPAPPTSGAGRSARLSPTAAPGPEAAIPRDTRAASIDARGRAARSHFPCPWQRPRPPFHNGMSKPTPPLLPKGADTWQRRGPLGPCWILPSPDLKKGGGSPPSSIH
ncbi:PREDICTED: uncharacterized protein LOC108542367 [Rhinopithecus bieti]|uniref:uncharacterized protein LOC108542367 n=1 Tax=Rhinopithecus bieti TaxID=61621 RepID=UPI00083BF703|nr:PREDICTED: uncharacterized protein LOC108542367 [Rhinopithecus bieti]